MASINIDKIEQNYFSSKKLQKKLPTSKHSLINLSTLNKKEYFSLRETAIVLGVGKSTVYRYCVAGTLKCISMNRRIVIRRKDIDGIFEQAPSYRAMPRPAKMARDKICVQEQTGEIVEYYLAEEVAEKYGYTKSAVHKMAAKRRIPKKLFEGVYLYLKSHIHGVYEEKLPDESIS